MSHHDGPTRTTGFAATATTLVALVAMAAAAPSVRGLPAARIAHAEILAPFSESQAMRAVAAVVAAAARDLLAGQQTSVALPAPAPGDVQAENRAASVRRQVAVAAPPPETLDQRLLDIPPPGC
jgi:hypothetical protein